MRRDRKRGNRESEWIRNKAIFSLIKMILNIDAL